MVELLAKGIDGTALPRAIGSDHFTDYSTPLFSWFAIVFPQSGISRILVLLITCIKLLHGIG